MERADDEELVLTANGTWGGGPLSFEDLRVMVREGVESPTLSAEDVDAQIDSLLS